MTCDAWSSTVAGTQVIKYLEVYAELATDIRKQVAVFSCNYDPCTNMAAYNQGYDEAIAIYSDVL